MKESKSKFAKLPEIPLPERTEPEDIAVFDDYAKRKIDRVFGYRDLSDEILSELGKEYDE